MTEAVFGRGHHTPQFQGKAGFPGPLLDTIPSGSGCGVDLRHLSRRIRSAGLAEQVPALQAHDIYGAIATCGGGKAHRVDYVGIRRKGCITRRQQRPDEPGKGKHAPYGKQHPKPLP